MNFSSSLWYHKHTIMYKETEVSYELRSFDFRIRTMRHKVEIHPGTLVKLKNPALTVYGELETCMMDDDTFRKMRRLDAKDAGVGTVISSTMHVQLAQMNSTQVERFTSQCDRLGRLSRREEIFPINYDFTLAGVTAEQFYIVLFTAGLFWARYDWITSDLEEIF